METLKFKTNIKCGGCVAAVTPYLDKVSGIKSWEVDTANPDKILTVESESPNAQSVIAILRQAGYNAEVL